tara:strand:- start:374 stop:853 length:480 start_codon:yes stop_codon:yes gene_type:complete
MDFLEELAREAASEEAASAPRRLEEKQAEDSLKTGHVFLDSIKDKIKRSRKPRMRTLAYYLCDCCDEPIVNPTDGFVVHGNIYIADPSCNGGLIGNNIPEEPVSTESIKKTVLCRSCFMEAIEAKTESEAEAQDNLARMWRKQNQPVEEKQYDDGGVPF